MSTINVGGGYESSSKSSQYWTLRDRLRNLTTALSGNASLDLRFINQYYYKKDDGADAEQSAALELFDAVCTRGSKGWYPEWDFTNGGVCGRLTEYDNNELRYGSQGLLEEASSTNQIRNPRGEGATGTTAPTYWSVVEGGTTINYTATTFNGWPATRVAITGTASGTIQVLADGPGVISASSGQDWTLSTGVILESGTLPTTLEHIVQERSSGGSLLAATNDAIVPDGTHKRFVTSRTLTEATTAFVSAGFRFASASGSVTCTLLILAPQLEQKSAPTSPILPAIGTPAASTRATETVTQLASISRETRKSNAGEWDFTNGGEVGAYREFLPDVPAVTGKGLLVEEGTTNQIRNPRAEGAVAGTPGTNPTGWNKFAVGSTASIVGSGYEGGWPYVDVRWNGTPSGFTAVQFLAAGVNTASAGQAWTGSVGVKLVGGSLSNVTSATLATEAYLSGGNGNGAGNRTISIDGTHRRFFSTLASAAASTASTGLVLSFAASGAVDFTLRFYAPQLEQKAFPTSPILPPKGTLAASTRDADRVRVKTGAWQKSGNSFSLYVECSGPPASSNFPVIASLSDSAGGGDHVLFGGPGTGSAFMYWGGSANGTGLNFKASPPTGTDQIVKAAGAFENNNCAYSIAGTTQTTDTDYDVTSIGDKILFIGQAQDEANHAGAYIKQVRIWPRRLSNAELESLVGNS